MAVASRRKGAIGMLEAFRKSLRRKTTMHCGERFKCPHSWVWGGKITEQSEKNHRILEGTCLEGNLRIIQFHPLPWAETPSIIPDSSNLGHCQGCGVHNFLDNLWKKKPSIFQIFTIQMGGERTQLHFLGIFLLLLFSRLKRKLHPVLSLMCVLAAGIVQERALSHLCTAHEEPGWFSLHPRRILVVQLVCFKWPWPGSASHSFSPEFGDDSCSEKLCYCSSQNV